MELGPDSKTTPYNGSLLRFITDSQKYTSALSQFKKYILWRYTIGSAAVNTRLIFGKNSDNSIFWVYLFFLFYKNTVQQINPNALVKAADVDQKYRKYLPFFNEPKSFMILEPFMKDKIAGEVIVLYTNTLQQILQGAPMVQGTSFYVYKVASAYPGLPDPYNFQPTEVPQIPFNSTSILSDFNYQSFVSPTGSSFLFAIKLQAGMRGPLYIDGEMHAYSNSEGEIILPHGVIFDIQKVSQVTLNYIDPAEINMKQLQPRENISMGMVYDVNEYKPTKSGVSRISKKPFIIFETVLR